MAKRIKEISTEDADRICKDIQLWWRDELDAEDWKKDHTPNTYKEYEIMPSTWSVQYGIEIDDDKPEYNPNE